MQSKAATVEEYLAGLDDDRRAQISEVRQAIKENLAVGFEEGMLYGMIGYYVPHSLYPAGYHADPKSPLPFVALASQKNHMAVYLTGIYFGEGGRDEFEQAYAATGKKLDAGKSCVRFKKLENLALDVIGQHISKFTVESFVEYYESTRQAVAR